MRCFAASTLRGNFAPCRSGEACQLVARHLLWRRADGLSHLLHQRCILPYLVCGPKSRTSSAMGRELTRSILDCRCSPFFPRTFSTSANSVVFDRHQQVPQAPNVRSWFDGSSLQCSAPPLVLGRSLADHWLPALLPIGSDTAHQPLQTSLSTGLQHIVFI